VGFTAGLEAGTRQIDVPHENRTLVVQPIVSHYIGFTSWKIMKSGNGAESKTRSTGRGNESTTNPGQANECIYRQTYGLTSIEFVTGYASSKRPHIQNL
jgi:hypothetical protein